MTNDDFDWVTMDEILEGMREFGIGHIQCFVVSRYNRETEKFETISEETVISENLVYPPDVYKKYCMNKNKGEQFL